MKELEELKGVISSQASLGVKADTLAYNGISHFTDYRHHSFNF